MQCTSDLTKLRDALRGRIRLLRDLCRNCRGPLSDADFRTIAFAAIELDNLVVFGLRQFAKSALLGGRTSAGDYVQTSVSPGSTEEAAAFVYASINPSGYANRGSPLTIREKDEITTRNPKDIEKVLTDYAATNLSRYALALSLNSSAFDEIKIFRHFFAHRCRDTYQKVGKLAQDLGLPVPNRPETLVISGHPNYGVAFYESWTGDLDTFFDLAV